MVDPTSADTPVKLVIDLSGEDGPTEEYVPLTPDELAEAQARADAAVKAEAAATVATSARRQLVVALRAGTATPAQVQAVLADVLAGK